MQFNNLFLTSVIFVFFCFPLYGQNSLGIESDIKGRIEKEYKIFTSGGNPDSILNNFRALRIESEKIRDSQSALYCTLIILHVLSSNTGNFKQLIEESKIGEQLAIEQENYNYLIQIYQLQSIAYYEQGLIELGLKQLQECLKYSDKVSDINTRNISLANTYINIANYYAIKKDYKTKLIFLYKSVDALKSVADTSEYLKLAKNNINAIQLEALGETHENKGKLDSAEFYYLEAYKLRCQKNMLRLFFEKNQLLIKLSNFYYRKKNYRAAINFSRLALSINKENILPQVKMEFYQILYKSYLEINKIDSSKYFSALFFKFEDSISHEKRLNFDSFFEKKVSQNELSYNQNIKSIIVVVSLILIILILFIWHWIRISRARIHQKYQELITKLSQKDIEDEKIEIVEINETSISSKAGLNIIDETIALLLKKLEKFEKSNKFTKKDLTLTSLAHDLGTNTRYISEIIKEYRGQNFNAYINTLRIQFITQKLYDEPQFRNYKIAYLAEASGFSSREVFATVFKKETGVTPSYFISQLVKSKDGALNNDN